MRTIWGNLLSIGEEAQKSDVVEMNYENTIKFASIYKKMEKEWQLERDRKLINITYDIAVKAYNETLDNYQKFCKYADLNDPLQGRNRNRLPKNLLDLFPDNLRLIALNAIMDYVRAVFSTIVG